MFVEISSNRWINILQKQFSGTLFISIVDFVHWFFRGLSLNMQQAIT